MDVQVEQLIDRPRDAVARYAMVPENEPVWIGGVKESHMVTDPPVRVGTTVRTPQKLRDVHPVYPTMARVARVEGTVIIEATIGIDGRLVDTRILRSIPLLDQAALDAVRQWEFTPSLLNGVPVPVIMTVTVTFTLSK